MKMLGQDLHTQEEFDAFHEKEFQPIVEELKKTQGQVKNSFMLAGLALVVALSSVVYLLVSVIPK